MNEHPLHPLLISVWETAVDAIIVIDKDGTIESVNPATNRLFGYEEQDLIGQNVKLLMPEPYRGEHDGYLRHYHATGERRIIGKGREVAGQRKDGSVFPIHLAVSQVNFGDRQLFTGVVRDISDLKQTQAELSALNAQLDEHIRQQAEALHQAQDALIEKEKFATLGRVSGGIAHEIRNPLNAIKTSAYYLLNAKALHGEKWREHLDRIDRQVTIIDNVVTALSDVAKLPDPKADSCDLREMLTTIIANKGLPASIRVTYSFVDGLPCAIADQYQLPIVFRNLIRNARDAMPEGGELSISGRLEEHWLIVGIRDTGAGMAAEILSKITEPFFSTKARGMGLGLAITKAIVEKNGGVLRVKSELGKGTEFSVLLPTRRSPKSLGSPVEGAP